MKSITETEALSQFVPYNFILTDQILEIIKFSNKAKAPLISENNRYEFDAVSNIKIYLAKTLILPSNQKLKIKTISNGKRIRSTKKYELK